MRAETGNEERRHRCRRSLVPVSPNTRGFSLRYPLLDTFRKAEVSRPGSLDSHWHRPLHITSFLSELMLTRLSDAVNVSAVALRDARKSWLRAPKNVREADSLRRPSIHQPLSPQRGDAARPRRRAARSRKVDAWVDGAPIHDRHEVQGRSGGESSHSAPADGLAGADGLADGHGRPLSIVEVSVEGREVVAVRGSHHDRGVPVRDVRAAHRDHFSVGGGANRRVPRRRDVDAVVESAPTWSDT